MEERTTTAGVVLEDGKYLVAKRMPGGPLSGKWEFIGGKNRYGETVSDTLQREWMEELGVHVAVQEYLVQTEFINKGTHYTLKCHRVELLDRDFQLSVHETVRFVTKEELAALDMGESDGAIRDYLLQH